MRYSVIIPAAGSGSRMGADVPKVLLRLPASDNADERSIIQRSVDIFHNDAACQRIVVCVPLEWRQQFVEELHGRSKVIVTLGGSTRQESVLRGVEALASAVDESREDRASTCVLVHDAARCCLSRQVVERVVAGVASFGACTAAIPVPDSLCKVSQGTIDTYVDRENVWAIQTPQGFLLEELRSAHFAAKVDGFVALDDASVVGRLRTVQVVEGDRLNIKVTHPADLEVAGRIVQAR